MILFTLHSLSCLSPLLEPSVPPVVLRLLIALSLKDLSIEQPFISPLLRFFPFLFSLSFVMIRCSVIHEMGGGFLQYFPFVPSHIAPKSESMIGIPHWLIDWTRLVTMTFVRLPKPSSTAITCSFV